MHQQGGLYVFYQRDEHGNRLVGVLDADPRDTGTSGGQGKEDHPVPHVWSWTGSMCD